MKSRLLVALAAGLLVGAADPAPERGEVQSQVIPPGSRWLGIDSGGHPSVYEFRRDGVLRTYVLIEGWVLEQKYTLMPGNPSRIDMFVAGVQCRGIYRLEGDHLFLCVGRYDVERPRTFTHRPKAGQFLWVVKRLK